MAEEKHIVWSDINLDLEDWRDSLTEIYGDASEDFLYEKMCESNEMNFYDERANLNIQLPREIIVIADLGLWNGRFSGYKTIKSGNIRDCLCPECDYNEWYVDKKGDFRCRAIHHDGTNHYLYRTFKNGVSDHQIESFKEKLYNGTATRADITRLTHRLGDEIGKVYGWEFPKKQKQEIFER